MQMLKITFKSFHKIGNATSLPSVQQAQNPLQSFTIPTQYQRLLQIYLTQIVECEKKQGCIPNMIYTQISNDKKQSSDSVDNKIDLIITDETINYISNLSIGLTASAMADRITCSP